MATDATTTDDEARGSSTVYTVAEVARLMKVGLSTVYNLIKVGRLRCVRVGTQIRVPHSAFVDFMEGR